MDPIEEYIRRVRAGEVDRFEQIYIYCCRMLGCTQDAQDAVQEIFIKAFTKIRSFEAKATFSSWLYKIAYHHCLNMLRKRNIRLRIGRLMSSVSTKKY
ncbi:MULTISPECIES: RNA polymerase sigma factor [Paenibacillus]|uniref:RNA polymerase sigma factor n=1 Tax=Paenibacillus TaxID=44249 RepID=UPI002FE1B741